MNELLKTFAEFFTFNSQRTSYELITSVLVALILALIIFILSAAIYKLRNINVLRIDHYSFLNGFLWVLGAVLLNFLVITARIINYNFISFIIVAMVWDRIFIKLFNQANNDNFPDQIDE